MISYVGYQIWLYCPLGGLEFATRAIRFRWEHDKGFGSISCLYRKIISKKGE